MPISGMIFTTTGVATSVALGAPYEHLSIVTEIDGATEKRSDDTQASVIKRADESMYTAKKTGKNRVVSV